MTTREKTKDLLAAASASLADGSFVRINLGAYRGAEKDLKAVIARKVQLKGADHLSFTYRYKTRDITKNYPLAEGMARIEAGLDGEFGSATLFTTAFDIQLDNGAKQTLRQFAASTREAPAEGHDRAKKRLIASEGKPYLTALGVTDASGNVLKASQDKYRQINRYVEILSTLVKDIPAERLRKVVDMGSGKGYLTFALYDYLANVLGRNAEVIGVEFRKDMVDLCNSIAKQSGFSRLGFVEGKIEDYDSTGADVLIALHACDTATDDAIHKGIAAGAELIVVAPCCHKQIRREIEKTKASNELDFLLKHGIFVERQAEMVTDGLRGMILDYAGYSTKIFEFISDQHTPKNVLIVAQKNRKAVLHDKAILDQIKATKSYFGIGSHYLERLVGI